MKISALTVAALLCASLPAVPAAAATFDLSYIFGANVLTATIEGTLQPDGNTVLVTGVSESALDGAPLGPLPFVDSVSNVTSGSGAPASLSLDGTTADLIACFTPLCVDGFAFDLAGVVFGIPAYSSGASFGDLLADPYNRSNFSLTPEGAGTAVPLPAPLALLLAGMAGLGLVARRRAA